MSHWTRSIRIITLCSIVYRVVYSEIRNDLTKDDQMKAVVFDMLFGEKRPNLLSNEVAPSTPAQQQCPLPRSSARTEILANSATADLQYWFLKPKIHLLKSLFPQLSKKLESPFHEIPTIDDGKLTVVYEFLEDVDCDALIQFGEKVVSYSSEVFELMVECKCNLTVVEKL